MKASKRAQAVPPSATLAVTARAKELKAQGRDIVGLGVLIVSGLRKNIEWQ